MSLRLASRDDVEAFSHLACHFYQRTGGLGAFNSDVFKYYWGQLLQTGMGMVILRMGPKEPAEALGLMIHPDVNDGDLTAVAAFWYFIEDPTSLIAGRLYDCAERALKERGVKRLYLGALLDARFPKVMQSLIRRGALPVQMQLVKDL